MLKLLLIISLALALSHTAFAQNNCSNLRTLLDKGDLEQAAAIAVQIQTADNATCNNLLGEVYLRKGRNDVAQKYFETALKLSKSNSEDQAASLNNLGLVYWNTGSSASAKDYIAQALAIRTKLYDAGHEKLAASYNDLGLVSTDPDEALETYEKALTIYQEIYGENDQKVAQAKANIGIIYRNIELFGDAQNYFNEALAIWKKLHPNGHPNEGFIHTNLGRTFQLMGNLDAAKGYYEEALEVYQKHYGSKHPEIARTFNLIGNVHNIKGEFETALSFYQQALITNSIGFNNQDLETNPSTEDYFNANTLLNSLYYKAQALEDLHHNLTLKFKDARLSLTTLQVADTLVDKIRQISNNEADKLELGEISSQLYENGVRLCYYMADVAVKKDPYYELSFYFSEKSKSSVLLEAISDASAKSFANIPDSKLTEENELKSEIAYYEQKLAQKPEETTATKYRERLFELKQHYNAFIADLEKNYPQYYNLKYNIPIPSVAQLQETLNENQAIVSYFIADRTERLYVYQISKTRFNTYNIKQTDNFDRYLSGLRNSIYFKEDEVYAITADKLYEILFPGSIHKSVDHLIIIPSGRLGTVPFEALLTKSAKGSPLDYKSLDYLINDYAISYQYASALYYQQHLNPRKDNQKLAAFLCAPVTFAQLADLPGTNQEISSLQNILSGKGIKPEIYLEANASEEIVKSKNLKEYRYLHFATHGIVNENNPALSRIFLKESETNDGNLFSGEIYNLQLGADLVTLSACETGLGKISKGEGIIGLSRALVYAGANNIVVSLWRVADASTSDLMIDFYGNISGSNYGQGLRQAKLKMIEKGNFLKPYYWAPFILIGQ
ncbi:CHAT domain-containing protein [Fulvivirga sp. 29W222]|uniref:CHAT domain-containing protein n=1 Tax=Fulvivirga marina TaxID=2494733 RepID=A0A937KBE5_9BACT|nr:CHAT domain-containing tetratricopeptide repeat protein [Fulvivirga marina]MBL6445864.1 CHAT domain-containing protein [Fulvivirga marina]